MAIGLGLIIQGGAYALKAGGIMKSHGDAERRDDGNIAKMQATVLRNNQLADRNYRLLGEEEIATTVAHGMDAFQLAKEIRAAKAAALTARGGSGSLSSKSLNSSLINIQRTGNEALTRKELNLGAKLRNLTIERQNISINTSGLNAQAYGQLSVSSSKTGTALKLAGVGVKAMEDFGYIKNSDGKLVNKFSGN